MNYPLISEYIEAIKSAEDNFEELSYLRPVLGDDGLPVMTSGNFAVVFKMKDKQSGKFYAVKCFTKEQKGRAEAYREIAKELKDVSSPYLVSIRYLEKELFVDTCQTTETEFPVLLMDWVEGKTLDKYLRENLDDKYALEMLAYRFSQLAQWLIPQPFAHGDLKPDNILVREDGSLVLVDYDGMYVPAMKGQKARELGSPDFRHPLRTENDFDEHIDDFSLLSILISLKAVSINTSLLDKYSTSNQLLFSEQDYRDINNSNVLKEIFPSFDIEINKLITAFLHYVLNCPKNRYPIVSIINSGYCPEVTIYKDQYYALQNKYIDEFGVEYTSDKKYLLSWHNPLMAETEFPDSYTICEGTEVICDEAFMFCKSLTSISLPKSLRFIGNSVFVGTKVSEIQCMSSMFKVDNNILYSYDRRVLYYYPENKKETCFEVPEQVKVIVKGCFANPKYLWIVKLKHVLYDFNDLVLSRKYISIPKGLMKYIDVDYVCGPPEVEYEMRNCIFEGDLIVENGVVYSSDKTILYRFPYWLDFEEYYIDRKCKIIASAAFEDSFGFNEYGQNIRFNKLKTLYLPDGLEEIKDYAFVGCGCLESITIPPSVKRIGNYVFGQCLNLITLSFLSTIENINKETFLIGKRLPGYLVNPYNPNALKEYKNCEIDIVICPKGTDVYYKKILDNSNTQFYVLEKDISKIKKMYHFNSPNFYSISKDELHSFVPQQLKEKLANTIYEISESENFWEDGFWIDFDKLKDHITNTVGFWRIWKQTNRFVWRQNLSGICYVKKDFQTRFIYDDTSFSSYEDAMDFACRVYLDIKYS